ncbi:MAG: GDCCVxC domain-containing (seleno)protein [Gammaproteobacteria bacterium]
MTEAPAILVSVLTCPHCDHLTEAQMPTDACQFFYECPHCHTLLKPKPGDCCVFCSYGSVRCPPQQREANMRDCC